MPFDKLSKMLNINLAPKQYGEEELKDPTLSQMIEEKAKSKMETEKPFDLAENLRQNQQILRDKIKMMNPQMQGPRQPGAFEAGLPAEQDLSQAALQSIAAGSFTSGGGKKELAERLKNLEEMPVKQYTQDKVNKLKGLFKEIYNSPTISPQEKIEAHQKLTSYLKNAKIRGLDVE